MLASSRIKYMRPCLIIKVYIRAVLTEEHTIPRTVHSQLGSEALLIFGSVHSTPRTSHATVPVYTWNGMWKYRQQSHLHRETRGIYSTVKPRFIHVNDPQLDRSHERISRAASHCSQAILLLRRLWHVQRAWDRRQAYYRHHLSVDKYQLALSNLWWHITTCTSVYLVGTGC